jgi:hypothetical protein
MVGERRQYGERILGCQVGLLKMVGERRQYGERIFRQFKEGQVSYNLNWFNNHLVMTI